MSNRKCRLAQWSDIPAMAEVAAKAFDRNDLCGRFLHPYRHKFPEDFITFFRRDIRNHFFEPCTYFLVTTVTEANTGKSKVVGAAKWKRQGKTAPQSKESWSTFFQHHTINLAHRLSCRIWPNRAADPTKANSLGEAFLLCADLWSGSREETWFLDMLSVDPDYQLQGHGRTLMHWGKDRAREEGICASLTAAEDKNSFYEKLGFVEVGRANIGPLTSVQGGAVMFCDKP